MLINLRNALMTGKRLPYDAEVEYLEFNGTTINRTVIDTGVKVTDPSTIKFEAVANAILPLGFIHNNVANGTWVATWQIVDLATIRAYSKNYNSGGNVTPPTTIDSFCFDGMTGLYVNQSLKKSFTAAVGNDDISSYSWLFGDVYDFKYASGATSSNFNRSGKLYSLKIYVSGVLVRDYIPVRVGTVGYLYDRVSGALFGNAGTGDFVLGPDVVPVEWLEGGQLDSGIAFINTGYTPNSSTKVESTAAVLSACGYSGRFGSRSRLTFGWFTNGNLYLAQGDHYYLGGWTAGTFYSFVNDIANRTVSVEGVGSTSTAAVSDWYPQLYPVYLFASNVDPITGTTVNGKALDTNSIGRIRMKSCSIWENNTPVHKFLPVRVGTDATTWEGAMMDVLTRRIYRNAGTGAFTYGNDLKYPIPAE